MNSLEKFLYAPFGNNIIIGPHIKDQLNFLKGILPEEFKGREMFDLGCGDGKVTVLLAEIFQPQKIFGCDVEESLVKKARKRGIEARVIDLEKEVPKGELAVIWGVLHHLKDPQKILEKIKNNFQFILIREPLKEQKALHHFKVLSLLEMGDPFEKEKIKRILDDVLGDYQSFERNGAVMALWSAPKM